MTSTPSRRVAVLRLSSIAMVALLVVWACSGPDSVPRSQSFAQQSVAAPRATPPAPFTNIDAASATQVLQYASTLEFVDELARVDTATITEGSRHALVRFSPEIGSRMVTLDSLKLGRITARWTRFPDSVRYPMATMVGYMWTDSLPTGWRMIFFPDDTTRPRAVSTALAADLRGDAVPSLKTTPETTTR